MKNQIDPNEYQDPGLKHLLELLEPVPPRSAAEETQTRARFMAELDELFESAPEKPASRLPKWLQSILPTQRRQPYASHRFAFSTLMALIAVFALLFGGAGATALASQASIPGDVLYPVKTGLEGAQLSLAAGAYAEAQLHLSFAQRRLDEIAGLIEAGRIAEIDAAAAEFQRQIDRALENLRTLAMSDPARAADLANQITSALSQYAQVLSGLAAQAPETIRPALQQALQSTSGQVLAGEVEFTGVLEAMTDAVWTVAGRSVLITSTTEFKGVMVAGDTVKVHAAPNADGTFTAREIELSAPGAVNENEDSANDNGDDSQDNSNENDNAVDENENIDENENGNDDNENDDDTNEIDNDNESSSQHSGETRFVGVVEAINATSWTVSGVTLVITSQTELGDSITVGDLVEVEAVSGPNGRLVALRLRLDGGSGSSNSGSGSGGDDSSNEKDNSGSGGSGSGNSNDDDGGYTGDNDSNDNSNDDNDNQ